jgi:hypothetical protein
MSNSGANFEDKAFTTLRSLLEAESLGLVPRNCEIRRHPQYFSKDRGSMITFDISIEVRIGQGDDYCFLWLWECKDYSGTIPVNDVEEFFSKVTQVCGVNAKAGLITSAALQKSAIAFARAKGMSVVRLLPPRQVFWQNSCFGQPTTRPGAALMALSESDFEARGNDFFALDNGFLFHSIHTFRTHVANMLVSVSSLQGRGV